MCTVKYIPNYREPTSVLNGRGFQPFPDILRKLLIEVCRKYRYSIFTIVAVMNENLGLAWSETPSIMEQVDCDPCLLHKIHSL